MHTTIKLTDTNAQKHISFLEVYHWLLENIGPRLSWQSVQVTGQGWSIETTSMLNNCLIINITDPAQAMVFRLRFGGEITGPNDIDSDWKNC
jgi:hypothetical protein